MLFGKRRPRTLTERYHDVPVFQPRGEQLEAKILMAIDLGGTTPPALPFAATAPYGISLGVTTASSAGADTASPTSETLPTRVTTLS